jgi:TolB-like protein
MRNRLVIVALLAVAGAAFAANPKVAVLDALLPEKMDKNVAIGVTEKISEELVASGRFMVLDRTTVAKSLEEIEFQMSGLVSDEDIRKAGNQLGSRLGAAFVVVARVSQVGDTYFISAKMIDVRTGEITAQASDESEGKIAITLKIAQTVGRKLATGVREAAKEPVPAAAQQKPATAPAAPPIAKASPAPAMLHSRFSVYYSQPLFFGETEDDIDSLGHSSSSFGFSMQVLNFVWKGLYVSGFLTAMQENASDGTFDWVVFEPIFDVQAGAGWGIPLGKTLQITAGVHAGYSGLTVGSYWPDAGDYFGGFCFGGDIGLDLVVMKGFAVCLRADVTVASIDTGGGSSRQEAYLGAQLGVGWVY